MFVDVTVPQAESIGLTVPDQDIKWNKSKEGYDYGPIDWDEFWQVVGGNGPCNKERVDARRKAKEDGKWVVEAAMAFADKRNAKKTA